MNNRKTVIRFFTIADYEEEAFWLSSQHKSGWKLSKMILPCFYIFEKCEAADVAYQLDYKNNTGTNDYFQIFRDYGWEYIGRCAGWMYFRKPLSETDSRQDCEIFSDNVSKINMINSVIKTRLFPIMIIFFCCVLPNFIRSIETSDPFADVFTILFSVLALLDIYLLIYCSFKLRKLRKKYKND